VPATCPYPEPARSSPYPHIPLPEDPFLHIIASALSALPLRFIILLGSKLLYLVPVLSFPLARHLSGNVLVDVGFPFHEVTVLGETKKNSVPFTTYTKLTLIDVYQCCETVCRGCHEIRSHYQNNGLQI
jgi:hypothetical protein